MRPYKVLVVDDSAFMRKIISDLIESDPDFKVTDTAATGREAITKVNELQPDLVTMDVEMPEMNGLEALKVIMANHPLPVIMLSGINEEGMRETIMALESGAFDFIRKPSITNSQDIMAVGVSLIEQMKGAMLAREQREARISSLKEPEAVLPEPVRPQAAKPVVPELPVRLPGPPKTNESPAKPAADKPKSADTELGVKRPDSARSGTEWARKLPKPPAAPPKPAAPERLKSRRQLEAAPPAAPEVKAVPELTAPQQPEPPAAAGDRKQGGKGLRKLVAVGCSTGGPRALKTFLENIPANFPAPIVIVQHMPPNFTKSLAQRLNTFSPLEVSEAEHGMILRQGAAYIAPGGYHVKVVPAAGGQYAIELTTEDARNGHRPSVDTLYESLLPLTGLERHAVIMTGMGSDGARMMKALYDSGVTSTFAENEETCVVYGMPRSAVELHCVKYVLPLQEIAPRLVQAVK
ncbi:chemotaxis protein CheY [Paenibacillus sp. FSL R7-0273]|uniref:protein-glutamate methylesterase/protein-glutamine glutaminase n=1 Tax=Paenibacillus sp. FSL R7-0273 TaxID=1536772 RepID=UPI0004F74C85|nr:chemotaxis response regulator protein-glutamate methylesterase [Paenibacillus sp. FSL R7-0273]AIQ47843.1 chemotaxis protein CheY [Paenibacillus sp. FSL R7-0273]OMF94602.1 chemotaxis response regulator protein-glutamate methylesterase [Paenibacillus sp. FSL R7-0273]